MQDGFVFQRSNLWVTKAVSILRKIKLTNCKYSGFVILKNKFNFSYRYEKTQLMMIRTMKTLKLATPQHLATWHSNRHSQKNERATWQNLATWHSNRHSQKNERATSPYWKNRAKNLLRVSWRKNLCWGESRAQEWSRRETSSRPGRSLEWTRVFRYYNNQFNSKILYFFNS